MNNISIVKKVPQIGQLQPDLLPHFKAIRRQSEQLCEPLETEDYVIQVASFASPAKWHLAHTAWFFETLLLKPFLKDYQPFHPLYTKLFNSYYDTIGDYHPRPERGLLSRPTVSEVYQYRAHINEQMERLLGLYEHPEYNEIVHRTLLGLNHEQQHQELFLTDIKYNLAYNPLKPAYSTAPTSPETEVNALIWLSFTGGLKETGFANEGFAYDNETPRHKVYIEGFKLASRPITNGEYLLFMEDNGYQESDHWLSNAWSAIQIGRASCRERVCLYV